MNGATLLVETLRNAGIDTLFSLSGNQIMPVYDACLDAGPRIIHTRHENAAVYMADAHAQLSGGLGVALVTAGPGFANALSALWSARLDEAPVLLLSGDSPVAADGRGAFQELDQIAMSAPVTKFSARPRDADELAAALTQAIRTAQSGTPGPVHVALPADVLTGAADVAAPMAAEMTPQALALAEPDGAAILAALAAAERPLIVTGPLLSRTRSGELPALLEDATGAPVVCLESPRGLRDPALGAFAEMLPQADLILSLGKPFDFTLGFADPPAVDLAARLLRVAPDAAADATRVEQFVADAGAAAEFVLANAESRALHAWFEDVKSAIAYREDNADAPGVHPRELAEALRAVLDEEAVLCIDGGEFGQWNQAFLDGPARIINGLSGAIGAGLSHAIAAKLARPDATVIVLMGDGTAGFHLAEFETAAREGIAVLAIVGNDARWNAEHQIQLRDFGPNRAHACGLLESARYDRVAEALGCFGAKVSTSDELAPAIRAALASGRPACLDVDIASLRAPVFRR